MPGRCRQRLPIRPSGSSELPRVGELAFDSQRKRMTTLHALEQGYIAFCKGAPEQVIAECQYAIGVRDDGDAYGSDSLNPAFDGSALLQQAETLAARGYRVLALAMRELDQLPAALTVESVECELGFLALICLIDPPRPEAGAAVQECISAGITPVMITGDHPATAQAVALRLAINPEGRQGHYRRRAGTAFGTGAGSDWCGLSACTPGFHPNKKYASLKLCNWRASTAP